MKQFLTYGTLDYQCLKQAGNLNDQDIYLATRQSYVNTKLMKIYQMLDGLNDPFYNRTTVLSVAADQENLLDPGGSGIITALNGSTNTIVRSSGSFVAGSIVKVFAVDMSDYTIYANFIGRIITGGGTGTYQIISGTDSGDNVTPGGYICISVGVIKSLSSTAVDVSSIYFQKFLRISDNMYTSTPGTKIRVFDKIEDPQVFFNHDKDPMALKRVLWYQSGDTINISVGASANAIGTVTGEYRGKPALFDDSTIDNTIDLPPEFSQMLVDEVTASYLIDKGKPIPEDINGRMANYAKAYEAAAASRAKALEIMNK